MTELRLVPAAFVVWAATLSSIVWGPAASAAVVALALAFSAVIRDAGQSVAVCGLGAAATVVAQLRMATARAWEFGDSVTGRLTGAPTPIDGRGYLIHLAVPGHPGPLTAVVPDLPNSAVSGATVQVTGAAAEASRTGVAQATFHGDLEVLAAPSGISAWANHVRSTFTGAVDAAVGEVSRGLIPAMVLGDTSLQTPEEQQTYIATGLSHLSAVSGSNVAIVTAAAAVLASFVGLGLRGRIACAAAALALFACLVGPEPSVLRASVMGLVGLAAVLSSSTAEPVHTLCLAVIGLILVDSTLALSYGFALSVAATAGIVALSPVLYRYLAVTGWPVIVVRALSVAIAADIVTMPIVALMAGQVSLVSVVANLLVAPVTAPVTILGLVAVVLSLLPGGLEAPVLWFIHPLAAWIRGVAHVGSELPLATIEATPLQVATCYGWIFLGLMRGRPRVTAALTALAILGGSGGAHPWARPVDLSRVEAHVVTRESDIEPVPVQAQLVVVLEGGAPHERPVVTRAGLPVIYPNRDGEVRVYPDGMQRAAHGRF